MDKEEIKNGEIRYNITGYLKKTFYLDHSCDEWIIGNIEQAKKFAEDLLKTIKEVEDLKQTK